MPSTADACSAPTKTVRRHVTNGLAIQATPCVLPRPRATTSFAAKALVCTQAILTSIQANAPLARREPSATAALRQRLA